MKRIAFDLVVIAAPAILMATSHSATPSTPLVDQTAPPARVDPAREKRLEWFREAKYGLFIHWGLYAIPAGQWNGKRSLGLGEWVMLRSAVPVKEYEKLAARFNPVKFNADEWVTLARDAGMKYIVITSKHHDGAIRPLRRVLHRPILDPMATVVVVEFDGTKVEPIK